MSFSVWFYNFAENPSQVNDKNYNNNGKCNDQSELISLTGEQMSLLKLVNKKLFILYFVIMLWFKKNQHDRIFQVSIEKTRKLALKFRPIFFLFRQKKRTTLFLFIASHICWLKLNAFSVENPTLSNKMSFCFKQNVIITLHKRELKNDKYI